MSQPQTPDFAGAIALAPKIRAVTDDVLIRNIDRKREATAFWLGLISGYPVFLFGSYGVNKTQMVEQMVGRLLSATFANELIPQVKSADQILVVSSSIRERTVAEGEKMVDIHQVLGRAFLAHVFFGDEFFKDPTNPALLELIDYALNGTVRHEGAKLRSSLRLFMAAGNELPDPDGLMGATWARMILRVKVNPLDAVGKRRLVTSRLDHQRGISTPQSKAGLTLQEVDLLRGMRPFVDVPESVVDQVLDVYQDLVDQDEGFRWIWEDDRRFGRVFDVLQAHALMHGRTQVTSSDLTVLRWLLWNDSSQIPALEAIVDPLCRTPFGECRELVDTLLATGGIVDQVCQGTANQWANAVTQVNTCKTALTTKVGTLSGAENTKVQSWITALAAMVTLIASSAGGSIDRNAAQVAYNSLKSALS
ncbi:hypothetical protein A2304_05325 [Candidatus Uhrbacteria bacterium RIFOXYB2_FULL_57_15]|uniref:Uncharacterized protein n=1 Tax=Candidatus Uhrbacteria bacterium RIFOXYB2_FULL_57_15 TaxID=1802422 RepID=A0A1F7W552_9BACT|nr:MAG: hypothetical protein A2304_05325 [Candidatus Uhrbacteria bacterium RIFOXYB2_FULL_57_15]